MAGEKNREIRIVIPEELLACLVPGKAREHLLGAWKEFLHALRSLIDARIESLDKKAAARPAPKKKIRVD